MKRGDVWIVAGPDDYGKPRPAVIVQSNLFAQYHASVTVCVLTTTLIDSPEFRITVEPSETNGLRITSQIMIDKIITIPRKRIGKAIGKLEADTIVSLDRALALWLGLGD